MSFAYSTTITVPSGVMEIQEISMDDTILASAIYPVEKIFWNPEVVSYSAGCVISSECPMIFMVFSDDQERQIICSTDQVFMLTNGKLIRAEELKPGDSLANRDARPVMLNTVSEGLYNGGIRDIAVEPGYSQEGSLILANGVIVGDYSLQLRFDQLPDNLKVGKSGCR
ncbi:MAG: hypothetical protein ABSC17_07255 [Thermacetogeniaceae bacterium]